MFWYAVIFLYINTSCTSFVYKIIVNEINFFPTPSYFNMVSWEVTFLSNPWLIFLLLLLSENYDNWSCAMSNALHAKTSLGLWMTPYLDWWRLLWMLPHGISTFFMVSWIFNSLSKEFYDGVAYANSAKAIWVDLLDRFLQGNPPLHQLKCELVYLTRTIFYCGLLYRA